MVPLDRNDLGSLRGVDDFDRNSQRQKFEFPFFSRSDSTCPFIRCSGGASVLFGGLEVRVQALGGKGLANRRMSIDTRNAHQIVLKGESYRKKNGLQREPLNDKTMTEWATPQPAIGWGIL